MSIEIKTYAPARVTYLRHIGKYGDPEILQVWQRLGAWCAARGLVGAGHASWGIGQDDPAVTAPDQCRYDAGVEVDGTVQPEGDVGVQDLGGGLYACGRFVGTPSEIHQAWMGMFSDWLPGSGYAIDARPTLEAYGELLQIDSNTGAFTCLLCLPVRPA